MRIQVHLCSRAVPGGQVQLILKYLRAGAGGRHHGPVPVGQPPRPVGDIGAQVLGHVSVRANIDPHQRVASDACKEVHQGGLAHRGGTVKENRQPRGARRKRPAHVDKGGRHTGGYRKGAVASGGHHHRPAAAAVAVAAAATVATAAAAVAAAAAGGGGSGRAAVDAWPSACEVG